MGKVLVKEIPPLTLGTIRFSFATLLLVILLKRYKKTNFTIERKHYLLLFYMGITGIFLFNYLVYSGLQYTTSTNSGIVNAFYPAISIVLSAIFIKEKFSRRQLLGIVFSVVGVVLIAVQGSWGKLFALHINHGDILVLLAAICWAVYSLLGKFSMKDLSPLFVTTYSCFFGLMFLFPGMFMELRGETHINFSWLAVAGIIYLSLVVVVAQFLWNRGLQEVGPDKAAGFYNLMPIFTALLSMIFLGEEIHWYHIIGGSMVLVGVFFGSTNISSKKQVVNNEII